MEIIDSNLYIFGGYNKNGYLSTDIQNINIVGKHPKKDLIPRGYTENLDSILMACLGDFNIQETLEEDDENLSEILSRDSQF